MPMPTPQVFESPRRALEPSPAFSRPAGYLWGVEKINSPVPGRLKTLSPKEATLLLESASAVIADDNILAYPVMSGVSGDPENIFLEIGWVDEDDFSRKLRFREGDNAEIKVAGSSIFIREMEADEIQITPLRPWSLE